MSLLECQNRDFVEKTSTIRQRLSSGIGLLPSKNFLVNVDDLQNMRQDRVFWQLLQSTTNSLTFSQDVVWERAAETIPYSQTDFHWLFRNLGSLAHSRKPKDWRRVTLRPLRRQSSPPAPAELHGARDFTVGPLVPLPPPAILLTGQGSIISPSQQGALQHTGSRKDQSSCRDKLVLKKPARTTPQQIPLQCQILQQPQILQQCQTQSRLQSGLTISAEDLTHQALNHNLKRAQNISQPKAPVPGCHGVPWFCRPSVPTNESRGSDSTATSVTLKCTETPLPHHDFLKPHTGNHVHQPEDSFQQQPFTEMSLLERRCTAKRQDRLTADDDAEHHRERLPHEPEEWTTAPPEAGGQSGPKGAEGGTVPGEAPPPIDCSTEMSPTVTGSHRERVASLPRQPPGHSPPPELSLLRYAVEDWTRAWKIKTSWQSVTVEGLKRALVDLHHRVRVMAVAALALRAVNGPGDEQDASGAAQYRRVGNVNPVPQELRPLLLSALDDQHAQVQMAAAVCQYAMGSPNPRAREVLHHTLQQGAGTDGWVAAQCLAMEGEANLPIVESLLSRIFGREVQQRDREQATALLVGVSRETTLVRSLLAEELNSPNWRNRVLACKTISQLKSPINKDLVNKLTQLMWNDWCSEARQVAAQTLGEVGRGRELHNELRAKLEEGPSSLRVKALVLLAQLRIMTARLLPGFLGCLQDGRVAVRKQACVTAAALFTKGEMIVNQLIQLMQDDPVWEVKVTAITALGKIGCLTPAQQKHLLLAIRREEEPEVRIAACKAIGILRVDLPELQHLLQQRLLLESHPQVHRCIEVLMESYGFSLQGDKNTVVHKIKDQVQKLCSKCIITEKVLLLEKLEDEHQQQRRFLGHGAPPSTLPPATSQLLHARYRELNHSSVATISKSTDDDSGIQPPCMNPEQSLEDPQPTPIM
ncbi:hypothetical protein AAFF_G00412090 [Aldrovandia affinis]|uniref:HEAT repeat-containing protein 4 n=1 Tax=Aldrovandia affinis TaxID=143900 RepID=A0AAD7SBD8_9TELE|nr:hypothetical protein AAFF_G00412090 [Aldrovandia affinis]